MFGLLDDRDRLRISLCLHSNSFLDRGSLKRAEGEFDLFITSDQNIRYQQNLPWRRIAILELSTNDIGRIQAASMLLQDATDKFIRTSSNSTLRDSEDFSKMGLTHPDSDTFPRY